jgi:hypothetical protein
MLLSKAEVEKWLRQMTDEWLLDTFKEVKSLRKIQGRVASGTEYAADIPKTSNCKEGTISLQYFAQAFMENPLYTIRLTQDYGGMFKKIISY